MSPADVVNRMSASFVYKHTETIYCQDNSSQKVIRFGAKTKFLFPNSSNFVFLRYFSVLKICSTTPYLTFFSLKIQHFPRSHLIAAMMISLHYILTKNKARFNFHRCERDALFKNNCFNLFSWKKNAYKIDSKNVQFCNGKLIQKSCPHSICIWW